MNYFKNLIGINKRTYGVKLSFSYAPNIINCTLIIYGESPKYLGDIMVAFQPFDLKNIFFHTIVTNQKEIKFSVTSESLNAIKYQQKVGEIKEDDIKWMVIVPENYSNYNFWDMGVYYSQKKEPSPIFHYKLLLAHSRRKAFAYLFSCCCLFFFPTVFAMHPGLGNCLKKLPFLNWL